MSKNSGRHQDQSVGDLLREIVGTNRLVPVKFCNCKVLSIIEKTRECIVESLDHKTVFSSLKVRYSADVSDGDINVPAVDSTVVIAFTDFTEPCIVNTSWLSKKTVTVGNQGYEIIDGSFVLNDGKYGGIPIVKDPNNSDNGLLKRLNEIEKLLNSLTEEWTTFCQAYVAGSPSVVGLPSSLSSSLQSINTTSESQISNPNITHGDTI